ncbi:MAG: 23S rRNA (guanosine(2251)-2'-O)-methyltransferase RlmB [Acutalibacteraceae bacterium]|jgi:23S rRNA (guanosine2251-2'-O)-methyltransferase
MKPEGERRISEDVLAGRNAVSEALRAGRPLDQVWVARGERTGSIRPLIAQCRERGIPIKEVDVRKMDAVCGPHHQGIAAMAACKQTVSVEEILDAAAQKGEPPFLVIGDELNDPHNLGAIIRTAEAAGAHGIIIPEHRSVGLTSTVYKASAGAVEYLPVARVGNLVQTIKMLKKRGVWVYGLDMDGAPWCQTDLTGPLAIVIGSEGSGLGRLVKEECDGILSLPMAGRINSLNASVACGIALYEAARQRGGVKAR